MARALAAAPIQVPRRVLGKTGEKIPILLMGGSMHMDPRFDPRLAEAVDLVPVSDASQDDLVVQEVRAGYRIGERVLRPARVRVGRFARA
jgi:hypothetical protein